MIRLFIDIDYSCAGNKVPIEVAKAAIDAFLTKDEHYVILPAADPQNARIVALVQKGGIDNVYRPYVDVEFFNNDDGNDILAFMLVQCPFLCCLQGSYQHDNGIVHELRIDAICLVPKPQIEA